MNRDYLYEMRLSMGLGLPRKVTKPKAGHHERMEAYWLKYARDLGRPGYHEAAGFARHPDREYVTAGREKPYGPLSRAHWKYVRLAMREAFLAEWHRQLGTTYETTEGGSRSMMTITGLTA